MGMNQVIVPGFNLMFNGIDVCKVCPETLTFHGIKINRKPGFTERPTLLSDKRDDLSFLISP
jgi:hypothetical protein